MYRKNDSGELVGIGAGGTLGVYIKGLQIIDNKNALTNIEVKGSISSEEELGERFFLFD